MTYTNIHWKEAPFEMEGHQFATSAKALRAFWKDYRVKIIFAGQRRTFCGKRGRIYHFEASNK